ncbi:hypothetical protein NC652_022465 [Populus alba x Populus x berolinensis]|nr:hypothetical protein NC652_022465 [Populus alba x Populus x berolinensis]
MGRRFTLEHLQRQPAGSRLKISEDMLLENVEQWQRCMVGFFPGFKMPYHIVNTIASRVWRKCGLEDVMTTANGYMLFRFKSEEEMQAVLEKGPGCLGEKLLFCNNGTQGLSLAASMVGRPLSCDEQTYKCTRLEYARVRVEIDASLPFVHCYEIDSPLSSDPISIDVEYEWKPSRCDRCKIFGHSCSTKPAPPTQENDQAQNPPIQSPTPLPQQGTLIVHTHTALPPGSLAKVARASATGNHIIAQDLGNVLPALSYLSGSNPVPCIESKMDSFHSLSASSSAAKEEYAETSTTSISSPEHHDISPPPSPKTVRKKKGGKKRKEARGL